MYSDEALASLSQNGQIDARVYTDPEIFDLEMQRIFGKSWIFLGHDSQLRSEGDFFLARIARQEVIVCRDQERALRAFYNRCAHRGVRLCTEGTGNANRLICPYHAWSFGMDGRLLSVPQNQGYADFPARREQLGLKPLARVAEYRGFIFGCQSGEGPELPESLGRLVCEALDNFVERSPEGKIEPVGGRLVQRFRANWKLQIENSIDLLHPRILHYNAIKACQDFAETLPEGTPLPTAVEVARSNGLSFDEWDAIGVHALDGGHSYMGTFFQKQAQPAPGESENERLGSDDQLQFAGQREYVERMNAAYGREKAQSILAFSRHNTIVYPNLFINPRIQQVRFLRPISVNETEQHCLIFRLHGAPPAMLHTAIQFLNASNSPASLATTDDHEIFERAQLGMQNGDPRWIDLSRGIGHETATEYGARAVGTSELAMRNQHARWRDLMIGAHP
jgi:benzoate/toluate 1,2-dioxygenase alpha subunit